jgi:hypothetical protein
MASTNDQITQKNPYPILTTLGDSNTDTSFATLQIIQQELNANAASVHTLRGDVINGHVSLVMQKHAPPAATAFDIPPRPPALVTHALPATSHTLTEENRLHAKARREFMFYSNADKALRI